MTRVPGRLTTGRGFTLTSGVCFTYQGTMAKPTKAQKTEARITEQLKTATSLRDIDTSDLMALGDAARTTKKPTYAKGPGGELFKLDDRGGGYREIQIGYGYTIGGTKIPSALRREGAQFGVSRNEPVIIHVDPDDKDGGQVMVVSPAGTRKIYEGHDLPEEDIINELEGDADIPVPAGPVPAGQDDKPDLPYKEWAASPQYRPVPVPIPAEKPMEAEKETVPLPSVQVDYSLAGGHQVSVMYHRIIRNNSLVVCVRNCKSPISVLFSPAIDFETPLQISLPETNESFRVWSFGHKFKDGDMEYLILPIDTKGA